MSPAGDVWHRIRERLAAISSAAEPDRGSARAILDARARRLAAVPPAPEPPGSRLDVVIFGLADERYALEMGFVCEVRRFTDFTPVPDAPGFLIGLTHHRGDVLPVIDLRKFFGAAPRGLSDLSRLLVVGTDRPEIAVPADSVPEVAALPVASIGPPPPGRAHIADRHLRGVTADAVTVLDGEALLADPRLLMDLDAPGA